MSSDAAPAAADEPLPLDEPAADLRAATMRLGLGVLLVLVGAVLFAGSRYLATTEQHAYDTHPSPRASYAVTGGQTYELSSATPTKQLIDRGTLATLACTWSADGQVDNQLPVTSTLNDERNRHQFALFAAPITGSLQLRCTDIPAVFVDDADNAGPDWAGALLVVATIVGLVGGVLAVSGGYRLTE